MTRDDLARRLGAVARAESEQLLDDDPADAQPIDPTELQALKRAAHAAFDAPAPRAQRWRRPVAAVLAVAAGVLLWFVGERAAPVRYGLEVEVQRRGELRGAPCIDCPSDDFVAVLRPLAGEDRAAAVLRVYRRGEGGHEPMETEIERASTGAFRARFKAVKGDALTFVVGPPDLVDADVARWLDGRAEAPRTVTIHRWQPPAEEEGS